VRKLDSYSLVELFVKGKDLANNFVSGARAGLTVVLVASKEAPF
jgi:hypothetical protein